MKRILMMGSLFSILLFILACQTKSDNLAVPQGFEIHPEFKMELVASEPLVFDPVAMQFDEQGNAFVLEMPGYPFSEAASRIIQLIDKNEDGQYDKRIVVAEDLAEASSFMPYTLPDEAYRNRVTPFLTALSASCTCWKS